MVLLLVVSYCIGIAVVLLVLACGNGLGGSLGESVLRLLVVD